MLKKVRCRVVKLPNNKPKFSKFKDFIEDNDILIISDENEDEILNLGDWVYSVYYRIGKILQSNRPFPFLASFSANLDYYVDYNNNGCYFKESPKIYYRDCRKIIGAQSGLLNQSNMYSNYYKDRYDISYETVPTLTNSFIDYCNNNDIEYVNVFYDLATGSIKLTENNQIYTEIIKEDIPNISKVNNITNIKEFLNKLESHNESVFPDINSELRKILFYVENYLRDENGDKIETDDMHQTVCNILLWVILTMHKFQFTSIEIEFLLNKIDKEFITDYDDGSVTIIRMMRNFVKLNNIIRNYNNVYNSNFIFTLLMHDFLITLKLFSNVILDKKETTGSIEYCINHLISNLNYNNNNV